MQGHIFKLLFFLGMMWHGAVTAQISAQLSMLVNSCVVCHGTNGSSVGPATPTIAGMRRFLFVTAMQDMKSGKRPSTVMGIIAQAYSNNEIELMADFFSTQKIVRYPQKFDAKKAQKGKVLYEQYCKGCHNINGRTQSLSNVIAGQWIPYLRIRLSEFRYQGASSPVMADILEYFIQNNSEDSLEELIHFYGSHQ
ncbi:MAG: hypothetical protein KAH77_01020 [Thiomargarita sp.]|nr:hypothetical protein [Thiomargarita sp.]